MVVVWESAAGADLVAFNKAAAALGHHAARAAQARTGVRCFFQRAVCLLVFFFGGGRTPRLKKGAPRKVSNFVWGVLLKIRLRQDTQHVWGTLNCIGGRNLLKKNVRGSFRAY